MKHVFCSFVVIGLFLSLFVLMDYSPVLSEDSGMPFFESVSPDAILIENFNTSKTGDYPKGWGWVDGLSVKKFSEAESGQIAYTIEEENGNKYLHADDTGQAITIVSDKKWNIKEYPCLQWRWRVKQFPTGANEKAKGKSDSAAGLYVTYYVNLFGVPRSIKYVWSNELSVCESFKKSGTGKAQITVVESGMAKKGVWVTETINIYEHYYKVFGEYPPDKTVGIAIRTDADGTNSRAIADYDDVIALKTCKGKCD
jgi:hypothetical protein